MVVTTRVDLNAEFVQQAQRFVRDGDLYEIVQCLCAWAAISIYLYQGPMFLTRLPDCTYFTCGTSILCFWRAFYAPDAKLL